MSHLSDILHNIKMLIEPLISISVLLAIMLFVAKEIVDYFKHKRSENNKKNALSFLICEEIKLNYWALKKLFEAYRDLANLFNKYPCAIYRTSTSRFGVFRFELKETPEEDCWGGYTLPEFQTTRFYNLLPSLAEPLIRDETTVIFGRK
jgi:hypothetical protein